MDDSAIMCDKVIESNNEEKKLFGLFQTIPKGNQSVKRKICLFYMHFY